MLQLGKINRLQVIKETPFGLYLGTEQHQVLLPSTAMIQHQALATGLMS